MKVAGKMPVNLKQILFGIAGVSLAINVILSYVVIQTDSNESKNLERRMNISSDYFKPLYGDAPVTKVRRMPTQGKLLVHTMNNKKEFLSRSYAGLTEWSPFSEVPIVAPLLPVMTEQAHKVIESVPYEANTFRGVVNLFNWFRDCQWSECGKAFMGRTDRMFCNDAVSLFRTILFSRGIISRPVIFEYKDGHGMESHTFIEVWVEDLNKWIYFDPFYKTYGKKKSVAEIIESETIKDIQFEALDPAEKAIIETQRKSSIARAFKKGWHLWYVENGMTGIRVVFQHPESYS